MPPALPPTAHFIPFFSSFFPQPESKNVGGVEQAGKLILRKKNNLIRKAHVYTIKKKEKKTVLREKEI